MFLLEIIRSIWFARCIENMKSNSVSWRVWIFKSMSFNLETEIGFVLANTTRNFQNFESSILSSHLFRKPTLLIVTLKKLELPSGSSIRPICYYQRTNSIGIKEETVTYHQLRFSLKFHDYHQNKFDFLASDVHDKYSFF